MPAILPMKMGERHKFAALLVAMGWKNGVIAKKLGMTQARLSTIKGSPLFKTFVQQYQRDFIQRGMDKTIDKVIADGPQNVDFLIGVRDGVDRDVAEIDDPTDRARVRLDAAGKLLDRQVPKRLEQDTNTRVHFVVESRQRTAAEDACAEVGEAIDVTPGAAPQKALPSPVMEVKDLDALIEEYEDRELSDA